MPERLYDKEEILDACLSVFAGHGYEHTSMAMLAEAAGVSKALLFHHFSSKKGLFLSLLDRCLASGREALAEEVQALPEADDFFETREKFSLLKYRFHKENPRIYRILRQAYVTPPAELAAEMAERADAFLLERTALWRALFEKVPLRAGVDRDEAFEMVMITVNAFEQKYLAGTTPGTELEEARVQDFIEQRQRFFSMIRFGIEGERS